MFKYIIRRLLFSAVTLFTVSILIFLLLRILPGDPARLFAGDLATEAEVQALRVRLSLDKPISTQYVMFLKDLSHGDLGDSMRTKEPVLDEIKARFPNTLKLAVISITIASIFGVTGGVIAAIKRNSIFDALASIGTLFGVAMPVFWLALMLILVFSIKLRWLPAAGNQYPIKSAILPSVTLALFSVALITRMTRASVLEVLSQEYVITARAKGLKESLLLYRHVLPNALIPVVTVIGLQFGSLLGGAILTETIFAWPGLGRLLTESLFSRDYPMVQGLVLVFSGVFILVNLIVDILYAYIDPRIKYD